MLQNIFLNPKGRLRSGWRFLVFLILFILSALLVDSLFIPLLGSHDNARRFFATPLGNLLGRAITVTIATLVGWACGRWLEDLPPRALGWALHRGWARDFLCGSLFGIATLLVGVGIGALFGGYRFAPLAAGTLLTVLKTLAFGALFFVVAGAAEEVLLRGYPLQTLLRSQRAWIPILLTAIIFGAGHLTNPNIPAEPNFFSSLLAHVMPERAARAFASFAFVNTTLAGVWLALAYLRTRSLWFPVGLHWAWNWALGPLFGLPVSGITWLSRAPLIQTSERGPAWLTGASYGIEAGAAATVAITLSMIFISRPRLVHATEEMHRLTSEEIPNPRWQKSLARADEPRDAGETIS